MSWNSISSSIAPNKRRVKTKVKSNNNTKKYIQLRLDCGQNNLGQSVTCPLCSMIYVPTEPVRNIYVEIK